MAAEPRSEANRRLLRARDTMDRCYAEGLDVEALASRSTSLARTSSAAFARPSARRPKRVRRSLAALRRARHRYLQRRRLERAMRLLRETDQPVTDICLDVGFTSLGTFSRTFHEIVGASPSEYREREQAAPRAAIRAGVPGCFAAMWDRPRI